MRMIRKKKQVMVAQINQNSWSHDTKQGYHRKVYNFKSKLMEISTCLTLTL